MISGKGAATFRNRFRRKLLRTSIVAHLDGGEVQRSLCQEPQ